MKYTMLIYWSDVDKAFIAEIPELPGCMADGPTRDIAIAKIDRVIDEWVETARSVGRCVPG